MRPARWQALLESVSGTPPMDTVDHRGATHIVAAFATGRFDRGAIPDVAEPAAADAMRRCRAAVDASRLSVGWLVSLIGGYVIACLVALAATLGVMYLAGDYEPNRTPPFRGSWRVALYLPFGFAFVLLYVAIASRPMQRSHRLGIAAFVEFCLAMRRCPSCGATLGAPNAARPDADGCLTCRCGAAWRADALGTLDVPTTSSVGYELRVLLASIRSGTRLSMVRDDRGRVRTSLTGTAGANRMARRRRRVIDALTPGETVLVLGLMLWSLPGTVVVPQFVTSNTTAHAVVTFAFLGAWLVATFVACRRLRDRRRVRSLRARCCRTCRGRLRREGDWLHCTYCGADWRRPVVHRR